MKRRALCLSAVLAVLAAAGVFRSHAVFAADEYLPSADLRNNAGLIGDRDGHNGTGLFLYNEHTGTPAKLALSGVADVAVSRSYHRAYAVTSAGKLYEYGLSWNDSGLSISLKSGPHSLPVSSPVSLELTPDGDFAYVSGGGKVIVINLKPYTEAKAGKDPVIHEKFTFTKEVVAKDDLGRIAVSPDGKVLYYVRNTNTGVQDSDSGATSGSDDAKKAKTYGYFGAVDISRVMNAGKSPDLKLTRKLPWEIKFIPKNFPGACADIETVSYGPNAAITWDETEPIAFYGPFNVAVSPDGNYALVTAQGREEQPKVTCFGLIPNSDDETGGVLVIDLLRGRILQLIPSWVYNDSAYIRRRMREYDSVQHPVVAAWDVLGGSDAMTSAAQSLTLTSGLCTTFFETTLALNSIYEAYSRIFTEYSTMLAYAETNAGDMVGATAAAVSPRGDFGLVTFRDTNNVGLLQLEPDTTPAGYGPGEEEEDEGEEVDSKYATTDFYFQTATGKTPNGLDLGFLTGTYVQSAHNWLYPCDVDITGDTSIAYIGTHGGTGLARQAFGTVDLELLRKLAGAGTGVAGDAPNAGMLALQTEADLASPQAVAALPPCDPDDDGLSSYVEAYNRFNVLKPITVGDTGALASTFTGTLSDPGIPRADRGFTAGGVYEDYLLPHSGIGYRVNANSMPPDFLAAGKSEVVTLVEELGRKWEKLYFDSTVSHARFVITGLASPGGGGLLNPDGEQVCLAGRTGYEFTVQYFRGTTDDSGFDFIGSNSARDPLRNWPAGSTADFDSDDTGKLIELLYKSSGVESIHLDPLAYESISGCSAYDSKIVKRGLLHTDAGSDGLDNDRDLLVDEPDEKDYGTRRDLDSCLLVVVSPSHDRVTVEGSMSVSVSGSETRNHLLVVNDTDDDENICLLNYLAPGTDDEVQPATKVTVSILGSSDVYGVYSDSSCSTAVSSPQTFDLCSGSLQLWIRLKTGSTAMDGIRITFQAVDKDGNNVGDLTVWTAGVLLVDLDGTEADSDEEEDAMSVPVAAGDSDGDGVKDYADGYNLDGYPDNKDDVSSSSASFQQLTLRVAGPFDGNKATVRISYNDSYPNLVAYGGGSSCRYELPPGRFRIWKKDAGRERFCASSRFETEPSDFVASGVHQITRLGFEIPAGTTSYDHTRTFYLECVKSDSDALNADNDLSASYMPGGFRQDMITVELDPDGIVGPLPYMAVDRVRLSALSVKLDLPDVTGQTSSDPDFVLVNSVDKDHDGKLDFAEFDGKTNGTDTFRQLTVTLSSEITLSRARVRFLYNASDPAKLTEGSGACTDQPGKLRIWKKAETSTRTAESAADGGDYVPNALVLEAGDVFGTSSTVTLYVEGIGPGTEVDDQTIRIEVNPDPSLPIGFTVCDEVELTVLQHLPERFRPSAPFHRVDLTGFPMAEPSPENIPETDQPESGLCIDAYSLLPYCSTADISIPLADGETCLEFRRSFGIEREVSGGSPLGGADLMGRGWRTNLDVHAVKHDDTIVIFGEDGRLWRYTAGGVPVMDSFLDEPLRHTSLEFDYRKEGEDTVQKTLQLIRWRRRFGTVYTFARVTGRPWHFRLEKITGRNDCAVHYDYADSEDVTPDSIHSEDTFSGSRLEIGVTYSDGRISAVEDPKGNRHTFAYASGRLSEVTFPDGESESYEYDVLKEYDDRWGGKTGFVALKKITDPRENSTEFSYRWQTKEKTADQSSTHRLVLKELSLPADTSHKTEFACGEFFNSTDHLVKNTVTTPRGIKWDWTFTVVPGAVFRPWEFEGEFWMQTWLRKIERTVRRNAAALGADVCIPGDRKWTLEFQPDRTRNLLTVTRPGNTVTRYVYGTHKDCDECPYDHTKNGRPFLRIDNEGSTPAATWAFHYEPNLHFRSAVWEPLSGKVADTGTVDRAYLTRTVFDGRGNPLEIIRRVGDADRTLFTYTYDKKGFRTRATDAEDRVVDFAREDAAPDAPDGAEWQITVTRHDGSNEYGTVRTCDANGNLLSLEDANHHTTAYEYDEMNRLEKTVLPLDSGATVTVRERDANGNVRRVESANKDGCPDRVVEYTYDRMNRRTSETITVTLGRDGETVDDIGTGTEYDEAGNVKKTIGPPTEVCSGGAETEYKYDELRRLTKLIAPEVSERHVVSSTDSTLSDAVDRKPVTYTRYGHTTDAYAGDIIFTSDRWLPTRTIDPAGYVTDTVYDKLGRVLSTHAYATAMSDPATDPDASVTADSSTDTETTCDTYNANGSLTQVTVKNPSGSGDQVTTYEYDSLNRQVRETRPGTIVTETEYDRSGNVSRRTGPRSGYSVTYTIDGMGRTTGVTEAGGSVSETATTRYDGVGNVTKTTRGKMETSTEYDEMNRPTKTTVRKTDTENAVTENEYDYLGNLIRGIDEEERETICSYDEAGRRYRTELPDGSVTWTVYDAASNVIKSLDEEEQLVESAYDEHNRIKTRTVHLEDGDRESEWEYDIRGNVSRQRSAQTETRTLYGFAGRTVISFIKDNDGGGARESFQSTCDNAGNVLSQSGTGTLTTTWSYDQNNRRTSETRGACTQTFTYDDGGALSSRTVSPETSAEAVTSWTRDSLGRVLSEQPPSGGSFSCTYSDDEGWLMSKTHPDGQQEKYTYNDRGERTEVSFPDPDDPAVILEKRTCTYDDCGNITGIELFRTGSLVETVTRGYHDTRGWLEFEERTDAAGGLISRVEVLEFDRCGRRLKVRYSLENHDTTVSCRYDAEGRLTEVSRGSQKTRYSYRDETDTRTVTVRRPDGTETVETYNGNDILISTETAFGALDVYSAEYTLDSRGRRARAVEKWHSSGDVDYTGKTTDYTYTDEGYLHTESDGSDTITYAYDSNGNRISRTAGTAVTSCPVINVLNQVEEIQYPGGSRSLLSYDANGNLSTKTFYGADGVIQPDRSMTFTYDCANRLTEVTKGGGTVFTAGYDAETRRISRSGSDGEKSFMYDDREAVIETTGSTETTVNIRTAHDGTPGKMLWSCPLGTVLEYGGVCSIPAADLADTFFYAPAPAAELIRGRPYIVLQPHGNVNLGDDPLPIDLSAPDFPFPVESELVIHRAMTGSEPGGDVIMTVMSGGVTVSQHRFHVCDSTLTAGELDPAALRQNVFSDVVSADLAAAPYAALPGLLEVGGSGCTFTPTGDDPIPIDTEGEAFPIRDDRLRWACAYDGDDANIVFRLRTLEYAGVPAAAPSSAAVTGLHPEKDASDCVLRPSGQDPLLIDTGTLPFPAADADLPSVMVYFEGSGTVVFEYPAGTYYEYAIREDVFEYWLEEMVSRFGGVRSYSYNSIGSVTEVTRYEMTPIDPPQLELCVSASWTAEDLAAGNGFTAVEASVSEAGGAVLLETAEDSFYEGETFRFMLEGASLPFTSGSARFHRTPDGDLLVDDGSGTLYQYSLDSGGGSTDRVSRVPVIYADAWGNFAGETLPEGTGNRRYFSTKETDPETGLVCFGYRYYDPELGRFITPDPLGDVDGPNRYLYCNNDPVNAFDLLGLLKLNLRREGLTKSEAISSIEKQLSTEANRNDIQKLIGQTKVKALSNPIFWWYVGASLRSSSEQFREAAFLFSSGGDVYGYGALKWDPERQGENPQAVYWNSWANAFSKALEDEKKNLKFRRSIRPKQVSEILEKLETTARGGKVPNVAQALMEIQNTIATVEDSPLPPGEVTAVVQSVALKATRLAYGHFNQPDQLSIAMGRAQGYFHTHPPGTSANPSDADFKSLQHEGDVGFVMMPVFPIADPLLPQIEHGPPDKVQFRIFYHNGKQEAPSVPIDLEY